MKTGAENVTQTHLQHDDHLPVAPVSIAKDVALQVMLNLPHHHFLALLQTLSGCFL